MSSLKIVRAESAGACFGVQRAIDLADKAAQSAGSVCTLGPLIHNPVVVGKLAAKGIGVADNVDDVETETVVIRSHGVVPAVIDALEQRGIQIIDATCPHVMRAQKAAAKLAGDGCLVIVVGEEGHPEVEGICAHAVAAGGEVLVVGSVDDLPDSLPDKVGLVCQTTQPQSKLDAVAKELRARELDPKVRDTVCSATLNRQKAARALASEVDVMIVIGGRNSSNTTRLYEICRDCCSRAHHIETVDEIDPAWFAPGETVGVSAGASTPEDQIREVIAHLEEIQL
jgi:4-hydroxy-3-methylbut-2-enyl diphosphate reductase